MFELDMIMPEFDCSDMALHTLKKQRNAVKRKAKFAKDNRKKVIAQTSIYTGLCVSKRGVVHSKLGTTYGRRPRPKRWTPADKLRAENEALMEMQNMEQIPIVKELTHTRIMATLVNNGVFDKVFDVVMPRNDAVAFTDYMDLVVKFSDVNLFTVHGNAHLSFDVRNINSDEADFLVKNQICVEF